jgi:dTMP kinase
MDSSIAYQGYGRELGDDVRIINEFAVQGLSPDLTFFLDMKPSQGLDRIEKER